MTKPNSCGLILLAAGASKRMGQPKQLLPVHGKPLLRYVVESALGEAVSPVIVVLGANAAELAPCLECLPVHLVVNAGWAEGMGSSLRCGMETLANIAPTADRVIIALADQPDLPAGQLTRLIETQRATGRPIVASECEGVRGPPVLFTATCFPELLALRGDTGARSLFQARPEEVATVLLSASQDLDTPADYSDYLSRKTRPKQG